MGFFSWVTQDNHKSICNRHSSRSTFRVYMVNPLNDEYWVEDYYNGYGVFGGKDFYELLAEINGKGSSRDEGIKLACDGKKNYISPVLVHNLENARKYYGFAPNTCEYQGYFY